MMHLATHAQLAPIVTGDPDGLHFRFFPGGQLHSARHGADFMLNLLIGCPLAGALHRLYVETEGRVVAVIAPDAGAEFGADGRRATWTVRDDELEIAAVLAVEAGHWTLDLRVANLSGEPVAWRAFHGLDTGLSTQFAIRLNESYASQYLDHNPLAHAAYGTVVATRQNLAVNGKFPVLIQGCAEGCDEVASDLRQVFGGPDERSQTAPPCLRDGKPLPGVWQGESGYVALRSRSQTSVAGGSGAVRFFGVFLPDHPAATSAETLASIPDMGGAADFAPAGGSRGRFDGGFFASPDHLHGRDVPESLLCDWFPGGWDVVERAAGGAVHSFFMAEEPRHVVTAAKERASGRPTAVILRSGSGAYPSPQQLSTTCYGPGIFNSLLSAGNVSFHRLLTHARETCGLRASAGQRVWLETEEGWRPLGIASAFEAGLTHARWIYQLDGRTLEVSNLVSATECRCDFTVRVTSGPPVALLVSHGLAGGINEMDDAAELELLDDGSAARVRPAPGSMYRNVCDYAAFDLRGIAGPVPEFSAGPAENAVPVLLCRVPATSEFTLSITASVPAAEPGAAAGDWLDMAQNVGLSLPGNPDVARLNHILPWMVQNAMIHFSVPHGIEQFNGGAWGTRDVAQGSLEWLLAFDALPVCRRVILDLFRHQYRESRGWPQWFMLPPFGTIAQMESHGDIPLWPAKALCDYLEASSDFAILDESVDWLDAQNRPAGAPATLLDHVAANVALLRSMCFPGTALLRYGDGDWNDSLQPADPKLRDQLVSSWTVSLACQVLRQLEEALGRAGRSVPGLDGFADEILADFNRLLIIDGTVCGFLHFPDEHDLTRAVPMLHPRDTHTGIRYSLIPMTRSINAGLFTPEQARHHLEIIREHLLAADGARLMDRPRTYHGGVSTIFKRAESAAAFSREIGLLYTHAHIRYTESLITLGQRGEIAAALGQANPAGIPASVPEALPRQANAYFSSSDAQVATRYQADANYGQITGGKVAFEGGWRIYSSGPGLMSRLALMLLGGIRRHYGRLVIDPMPPADWDGVEITRLWNGRPLRIRLESGVAANGGYRVTVNGIPLETEDATGNPYRPGGWTVALDEFERHLTGAGDLLVVAI